jgi:adenine phosphoribosyltransferase
MSLPYPHLESLIATTPDWPAPGVLFRDISPLLAQRFNDTIDAMAGLFDLNDLAGIDGFAGIDARGFIFAAALAVRLNKNMIMIRKGGKLPPPAHEIEYQLEYGEARLALKPGQGRVILCDDVVATGGTLAAAAEICRKSGYQVAGFAALIDLKALNSFTWQGLTVRSVFKYD